MNEKDFVYWLQGWIELEDPESISDKQLQIIKDHLKLVFDKVTPVRTPDYSVAPVKADGPNIAYRQLSDLIGKEFNQPTFKPPYEITCSTDPKFTAIC